MSVEELFGRTLGGKTAERRYIIKGESTGAAALAAMLSDAPTTYNGIARNTLSATITETDEEGTYEGRVPYGSSGRGNSLDVGDTRIQFSLSSTQTTITHSLNTEHKHPSGATDRGGAIGETPGGDISGTTIFTPTVDFTITKVVASSAVTSSYLANVIAVRDAPVNSTTFAHTDTDGRSISFAAGECLFLGMTNAALGDGNDELTFSFVGSANVTGFSVGSISGIAKDGWEHLWVYYRPDPDDTAKTTPLRAVEAYVEKVYERGSYGGLSL